MVPPWALGRAKESPSGASPCQTVSLLSPVVLVRDVHDSRLVHGSVISDLHFGDCPTMIPGQPNCTFPFKGCKRGLLAVCLPGTSMLVAFCLSAVISLYRQDASWCKFKQQKVLQPGPNHKTPWAALQTAVGRLTWTLTQFVRNLLLLSFWFVHLSPSLWSPPLGAGTCRISFWCILSNRLPAVARCACHP